MKKFLVAALFLIGCTPKPTGYFGTVHDEVINGVREVHIDTNEANFDYAGIGMNCLTKDGIKIPDWGVETFQFGFHDEPGLLDNIKERIFGAVPDTSLHTQFVVRFQSPRPPEIEEPEIYVEHWMIGTYLLDSGQYDHALCKATVYWIEPDDGIDPATGWWDLSKWYETESIEF